MISSNNHIDRDKLFRRLALLTVLIIYLLILAGGIVRSTGSGMGCPDWPKCFGRWVPPTNITQLPADYQEVYSHRGYADTTFNAVKTWIEYINRLLGVLTGFFVFFTLVSSTRYIRRDRVIFLLSFLAFLLVGVQGWLGSVVVKTVLNPWTVTLHMMLAIVIVGVLLYVVARTYATALPKISVSNRQKINSLLAISTVLLMIQIVAGTQVRQMVDVVSRQLGEQARGTWLETIGGVFFVHRSFSLLVLGSQVAWYVQIKKAEKHTLVGLLSNYVITAILANILTGVVMAYAAIPPFAQPIHLTLAVIALGIQFVILLFINRERLIPEQRKVVAQSTVQA